MFSFRGERYSRSLSTTNEREALGRLARLDDNLRRFDLGLLTPPDDVDNATLLLTDGHVSSRPVVATVRYVACSTPAVTKDFPPHLL